MDVRATIVYIYLAESKGTADFIADRIEEHWDKYYFESTKDVLFLNADNGPENNSSRTQFIKRLVEFSAKANIEIILAYYPPYHSKYNPIERVWGILEQHWNGDLLDSKNTVIEFVKTMTWNGKNPNVTVIDKTYETGITLNKNLMEIYEAVLERATGIEKWFISIKPNKSNELVNIELLV